MARKSKSPVVVEESKKGGMKFWKKNKRKKKAILDNSKSLNEGSVGKKDVGDYDGSNKENTPKSLDLTDGGNDNIQHQNEVRGSPESTSSKSRYSQLEVTQPGIIGGVNQLTLDNDNIMHDVKDAVNVSADGQSIPPPPLPPPPPKSSPPASPWKDINHDRNKMCIKKLQELARQHGGGSPQKVPTNSRKSAGVAASAIDDANTPSKTSGNASSPTVSKPDEQTPTKPMTALQQTIKDKILGSSPTWKVQKETKEVLKEFISKPESSPSSVVNLSSLKNGIQEFANSSLTSIFNCATTLKQVQCENIQDGVYELKEDLFYTYGKNNRHERDHEYDDYYDEESFQTDDDGTRYTYDDTTYDGTPTIATKETKTTRDTSIFDDVTSLEGSLNSNSNEPRSSPTSNQQQQQSIDKEDEFPLNSDNLQPRQMEKLGIPMNDKIPSGDIPMKERSPSVQGKHLANPTTSNIPWDERSVSSKSSDMGVGTRGVRLAEGGLVSLHDIDKSMRMNSYHEEYELQNPLRYRASSSLRKDEGEI